MMNKPKLLLFSALVLLCMCCGVHGDLDSHNYEPGEQVILYVNKVGPYQNPQETYAYYSLPYCKPKEIKESKFEGLGEAILGYELIESGITIRFREDSPVTVVCEKDLKREDVLAFRNAVLRQYWYQMFLDDLPVWGMVGESFDESTEIRTFLYTHLKFVISYNENRVIEVNLTSENPVPIEPDMNMRVAFTYSVSWYPTAIEFEDRFKIYLDKNFFEHQIHWFSIFNSFMMVIFLVGLVSMILMRTLRRDYARFKEEEDPEDQDHDIGDESGWKQIHGDVFRQPPHLLLLSALVGTGHQLALLILLVLVLAELGGYYSRKGTIVTAFVVCYALTSFVAGYGGSGFYSRYGGKNWMKCMLLTSVLFPGICFAVAVVLNFIALSYGALNVIPPETMFALIALWALVSLPLTLIGTVIGKNWNGTPDYPCRINQVPRQIPEKPWWASPWTHVLLGGVLPFGSIFIEIYFVFTCFYKFYYVFGLLLLVYIILLTVTICVTIVSTYFLLNGEDYRWQWTAFGSAASTGLYVFAYSIYYYLVRTNMSGFLQAAYYFGMMCLFCLALGILCGAVGFIGTSIFVKRIYHNVKVD